MASHAEGIEAERLLLLARDSDQDRGPFDFVRLPAEPVRIEHNVQVRPGIDAMPSATLLRHRLLDPLWLWLFRHFPGLLHGIRRCVCAWPSLITRGPMAKMMQQAQGALLRAQAPHTNALILRPSSCTEKNKRLLGDRPAAIRA
jgi:hypothetical protein